MVEYVIEERAPLDSEIDEIVALMNRVWLHVYRNDGFYRFDRDLFEWYANSFLRRDERFWLAIEAGSRRIIGFAIGMPRMITIHGEGPYFFGYASLITVDLKFQRQGIAKAIADRSMPTVKNLGLKGWFAVVEEGSKGLKPLPKELTDHKVPLWTHEHAYIRPLAMRDFGRYVKMKWYERMVARLLQGVAPVNDPRVRDVRPADYPSVAALLNGYSRTLDLGRVWDLDELTRYYANPIIRGKVFEAGGMVQAVVNAAVVPFSAKGRTRKIAILENLHYERIPYPDQRLLVRALLHELKALDVACATDFAIGYNSLRPMRSNRFLKYRRKMTLYFFPIAAPDDEAVLALKRPLGTTYIDIR